jgi:hypothetical protein
MRTTRFTLAIAAFLCALFLSPSSSNAQTATVNYDFLVLDTNEKPVADAKVESVTSLGTLSTKQTDERGVVRDMPAYYGDSNTYAFRISKSGYITYEATEPFDKTRYSEVFASTIPQFDEKGPIKIVLLRVPATEAEREVVEAELRRRELLRAVKRGDVATARKLLQIGASPNAADVNGIPAILFAAANGDGAMIKALLAAGADVRSKSGPGRKALLHYISRMGFKSLDVEVVRSLVKAGADVNAADKNGSTVLVLARQSNNRELIKLLGGAGAHQ